MAFTVLCLDGGGSKGTYTIGVLKEVEAACGEPLHKKFNLIYGTSTGAIIAALISLGMRVADVAELYMKLIPSVMGQKNRLQRSQELRSQLQKVFEGKKFDAFLTLIGIVATDYGNQEPFIFKRSAEQAFGLRDSFVPGYGCTIADALLASTAAFPFFERTEIATRNQGTLTLMDGGFVANNPTLFAIADAVEALRYQRGEVKILSVGVGRYNQPRKRWYSQLADKWWPVDMLQKQLEISSHTVERLREVLFSDIACVRVDETYLKEDLATNLLEADPKKLSAMETLGRASFGKFERDVRRLLEIPGRA